MSPYHLYVLIHYYCLAGNPPPCTGKGQACEELVEADMLARSPDRCEVSHYVTERGKAFIEHIRKLPLPTAKYVVEPTGQA